ncbi:MAG: ABC transporter ATP-binding protein [Lachnospiraceae bacterium]|nr:ABC transporter ATP-binding protein [Lachnospiraceae bacterium]
MKEKIKFVLKFARPHKWKFIIMLLSIILATITLMILPFIIGWLVDEVRGSQNMSRFIYIVSVYGVVYIFNQAMYTIVNIMEKVTSTTFLFDIRAELYSRILRFKGSCLANMYSGDTISRMGYDVDQIMSMISINLFGLVSNFINMVIALVFIYCANIWMGVFTTVTTPVIIYVSRIFFGKAKRENSRIIKKKGILSSWTFEILGGMQEIKLLHASKQILSEFLRRNIEIARMSIGLNKIEVKAERLNAGILVIAQMCMFTIAAFLVKAGELTIGGVTACFTYYTNCITTFNSINSKILSLSSNMVSCDRIMQLFDAPLEEEGAEHFNKSNREQIAGGIEFKNVSFSYKEGRNVFKDLSFRINPCEKIAIVGNSGVGKSTLVNLLCRIYDVNDGNIFVDGKDIMEYNIKYLREQIGVVHQNSIIFNGSIRFNLQFAWDKFQDDLLWEALKMADLYDFVSSLEDGLDTIVGTGGLNFSGGQKQRIAIARAFVKNSPIMIFDESTSALDSESEMTIKKSWELLGKNHTLLIIAHRLSTIINSDRIIVFEDGKVAGFGKHEELLETCEIYNKLFREQYSKSMGRGII